VRCEPFLSKGPPSPTLLLSLHAWSKKTSIPPQPQQPHAAYNPQKHGNWAQWIAPAITLVIGIITILLQLHLRSMDREAKISDEHVNALIAAKLDDKMSPISSHLTDLDTRIGNVRTAVQTLADNQSKETQKIVNRLIGAAQQAAPPTAARILDTATSLIAALRTERVDADPQYFQKAIDGLNRLKNRNAHVVNSAFFAKTALAEYRSALQTTTDELPPKPRKAIFVITSKFVSVKGFAMDLRGTNDEAFVVAPPLARTLADGILIKDNLVAGGTQLLDGLTWESVTFVGTHIRYQGGGVHLANVQFVNCTFDVAPSDNGASLAEYAALLPSRPLVIE
jgi:uncharacterized membrane-anchored protein YhcB (DUF1043 family)